MGRGPGQGRAAGRCEPMEVKRSKAPTERTGKVAAEIPRLRGPCVACADCKGLCAELIEVMTLPDAILKDKPARKDREE